MKIIKIKDYTTRIPAEKTIAEIEKLLAMFGANAVMKEYSIDGLVRQLAFKLDEKTYKLPAKPEGVYELLFSEARSSDRRDVTKKREARAYNVAWRIVKDWLHAQLSILASKQAEPDEVMLPYLWDGERTIYEAYKSGTLQIENKDRHNP